MIMVMNEAAPLGAVFFYLHTIWPQNTSLAAGMGLSAHFDEKLIKNLQKKLDIHDNLVYNDSKETPNGRRMRT